MVALMATMIGLAGSTYFVVALALGLLLVLASARLARSGVAPRCATPAPCDLVYLPSSLVAMAADKLPVSPW